jgi:hypothetical protein
VGDAAAGKRRLIAGALAKRSSGSRLFFKKQRPGDASLSDRNSMDADGIDQLARWQARQ